jgi:hypothetical protein
MTYVLTTTKLDATGHRWLAALAAFSFGVGPTSAALGFLLSLTYFMSDLITGSIACAFTQSMMSSSCVSSSSDGTMSGLTARLSMYAFGRIELQMACTDSMEMVSLLWTYTTFATA